MFSWFKKKSGAQPPLQTAHSPQVAPVPPPVVPQGPPQSVLVWQGEIATIRGQFQTYLQEVLRQSEAEMGQVQTEFSVLDHLWNPAERSLAQAQQELTHAWNRAKTALARDPLVTEEHADFELDRYEAETDELEFDYQEVLRNARAQAANAMMQFALHSDARTRYCVGCQTPLVNVLIGQTQNMRCPSCGVEQEVSPGTAFRMFAVNGARWVGDHQAFPYWRTMTRAETRIQNYRDNRLVPLDLLKEYHDAAQACWGTVFGVEAQLVPQGVHHVEGKVKMHMKPVIQLLRSHWQWREFESESV